MARGFAVQRYRRALSVACAKAQARYIISVILRESPANKTAATYSAYRARLMQCERDAYAGKHKPFRVDLVD